ncbi:MAG: hypothetical protein O2857_00345 [Planctomycetota bacterium]|nr:hypothetical protein [Planctomycetota bacterium]
MFRLLLPSLALLTVSAQADQIVLKNGQRIKGTITRADDNAVSIKAGPGELTYPGSGVESMDMNEPTAFKSAREAFNRGDFARTLELFDESMKFTKHPVLMIHAKEAMSVAFLKSGQAGNALKEWATLVESNPAYATGTFADFLMNAETWDSSFAAALESTGATKAEMKAAITALNAMASVKGKNWAEAEKAVSALRADTTALGKDAAEYIQAKLFIGQGKSKQLIDDFYERAESLTSIGRAYGFYGVGLAHLGEQRREKAMLAFLRVGLLQPGLAALAGDALYEGAVILETDNPEAAANFYKQIVRNHLSCSHWEDAKKRLAKLQ